MGNKKPNREILGHQRKRQLELKCIEMQELMEEQGYDKEEIERKVSSFREMLMQEEGGSEAAGGVSRDENGRPIVKDTHEVAQAQQEMNEALRVALGLSEYFVDGSSMDPTRQAKEDMAKAKAMASQNYAIVQEPEEKDDDDSDSDSDEAEKKKKEKKNKGRKKKNEVDDEFGSEEEEEQDNRRQRKNSSRYESEKKK